MLSISEHVFFLRAWAEVFLLRRQAERGSDPLLTPITLTCALGVCLLQNFAQTTERLEASTHRCGSSVIQKSAQSSLRNGRAGEAGRALERERGHGGGNEVPWVGWAMLVFQAQDCTDKSAHLPLAAAWGRVLDGGAERVLGARRRRGGSTGLRGGHKGRVLGARGGVWRRVLGAPGQGLLGAGPWGSCCGCSGAGTRGAGP